MATARKIVVLEDDRSTGALISVILEKEGYNVLHALEGRSAIELVIKERPSLLISDVLVPDMNGSEVVKELRRLSTGETLQTLFLTSLLDKKGEVKSNEEKTLKLDGVNYPALAKPFDPAVLIEIVRRLAGDPAVEDAIQVEVEKSIETQAMEAEAAVDSQEKVEISGAEEASKES